MSSPTLFSQLHFVILMYPCLVTFYHTYFKFIVLLLHSDVFHSRSLSLAILHTFITVFLHSAIIHSFIIVLLHFVIIHSFINHCIVALLSFIHYITAFFHHFSHITIMLHSVILHQISFCHAVLHSYIYHCPVALCHPLFIHHSLLLVHLPSIVNYYYHWILHSANIYFKN